ncbi:MAG: twin-arginine translocation signal domain-containing protein, partial [Mesorhizobium sp.]
MITTPLQKFVSFIRAAAIGAALVGIGATVISSANAGP